MFSREGISDTIWKWRYKLTSTFRSDDAVKSDHATESSIDDPKAPSAPSKDPTFGADAVVKTFYEGKNSNNDYYDWVDYPPKQLSKSAAKAQDRVAIKVYKVKDKDRPVISGRFYLKYHMIEIQNQALVTALKDIVKKESVYLEATETATFKAPFRALYFCSEDISNLHGKSEDGSVVKQQLGLLLRVMGDLFNEVRLRQKRLMASGLVSYQVAWTYFPKDSVVYSWGTNCELLCKVVDTEYRKTTGGSFMVINTKIISFDGKSFIWKDLQLEIPKFEGNKPITEMPHYPLKFHEDPASVTKRLTARGKKVLDFQGLAYCSYTGVGLYREKKKVEKHNVDGRILIDIIGYNKHHLALGVREGDDPESQKNRITHPKAGVKSPDPVKSNPVQPVENGTVIVGAAAKPAAANDEEKRLAPGRLNEAKQKENKDIMLAREKELIYISPLLEGYSLKNKLWMSFYVDDINPMAWNDEAYDHLVYDEQQKDLVLSFVENHTKSQKGMNDVIMGKGQGLIILLSGPPGTGKTLTAEAVADRTRRPLFYLQAEDLGVNAATLGANIKKVFEMATEWNAVILLDEADVFMAERCPNDIARNELVSIFLRELEYFKGIIFLTTNLYDTIDTAFRSRVSIHLLFNPLSPEARLVLWRKFLERLPADDRKDDKGEEKVTEDDLKELARWQLNGREIKNAIKMVQSWCNCKEYDMTLSRLESGIKVTSPHASRRDYEFNSELYE